MKKKEIVKNLLEALKEAENDKLDVSNLVLTYRIKDVCGNPTIKVFHMGEVGRSIELLKKTLDIVEKDVEEIMRG